MKFYIPIGNYSFSIIHYQSIIDGLNAASLFTLIDDRRKCFTTKIRLNFASISILVKLNVVKENNHSVVKCYANIFKLLFLFVIATGLATYVFVSIYNINNVVTLLVFAPIACYGLISYIMSVRKQMKKKLLSVLQ
ncbi:hypothetical protein [Carboxylicivirga sp. N1Y90]|uniref:hypothetical protein n=1 Tax=Carboxylicivirga fragile TaxID=3417571 RepID=UPI003D330315|nr:hypothetical protein [Marinilabiliaceae bacterium N1Y90]